MEPEVFLNVSVSVPEIGMDPFIAREIASKMTDISEQLLGEDPNMKSKALWDSDSNVFEVMETVARVRRR